MKSRNSCADFSNVGNFSRNLCPKSASCRCGGEKLQMSVNGNHYFAVDSLITSLALVVNALCKPEYSAFSPVIMRACSVTMRVSFLIMLDGAVAFKRRFRQFDGVVTAS